VGVDKSFRRCSTPVAALQAIPLCGYSKINFTKSNITYYMLSQENKPYYNRDNNIINQISLRDRLRYLEIKNSRS